MVAPNLPNGLAGHGTETGPVAALCVHFAAGGVKHRIDFAEPAPRAEIVRAAAARLTVEWDAPRAGLLRGRAMLRGDVACEAYLLLGAAGGPGEDRDLLRAAGLPREWAALLARMPERPLLATVARGPEWSPHLLRRVQSLLIAVAGDLSLTGV
jgi:hypothetical protein